MIKKLDIESFGIFNSFDWNKSLSGDYHFQKVNIIYGRNYSGKTTLSRIFRCIEKGTVHKDHADSKFSFDCYDGCTISHVDVSGLSYQDKVRVYNTDFVNENLSWIHDADGTILPFTILGSRNIEIDNKIKDIDKKLGSQELKKGLIHELSILAINHKKLTIELNKLDSNLQFKLKNKANNVIKVNRNFFIATAKKKTYHTTDIQEEIDIVRDDYNKYILNTEQKDANIRLLKEQPKAHLSLNPVNKPNFDNYRTKTHELLSREIKINSQIHELLNDALLQEWVRHGIEHHRGKRDNCVLCGNTLDDKLWNKLDAHFSQESEDLRKEIESLILVLETAKAKINSFWQPHLENCFYSSFHERLALILERWKETSLKYSLNLEILIQKLRQREQSVFQTHELGEVADVSDSIVETIKLLNEITSDNNSKSNTLEKEQLQARRELRLSEVASFAKDIEFNNITKQLEELTLEETRTKQAITKLETEISILIEEKSQLERSAKDETRGADLVNRHVSDFFGHDELKLVADGEAPNVKFKVVRDGVEAKNLSEGECSLISFCYFIARIEDEMNDIVKGSKLIIYIDDPISSLDGNHIFFMFSLIESVIAKPKKYGQLFISTHNLDFLKYLKRLTIPEGKQNTNHFLIERRHKRDDKRSFISAMPNHIKEYTTEFNYLFGQIYDVYKEVKGDKKARINNSYNQFYNLPNNLRKFLECYLFYRFPNNANPLENLPKLFEGNVPSLINRVINEYSHLTYIDRGWKPIDVDEVEECAKLVIEKIQEKDPEQFAALLESVS